MSTTCQRNKNIFYSIDKKITKITAENVPTNITVEKVSDKGPNYVMNSVEVMSISTDSNVESVRKQLFPPDELDVALEKDNNVLCPEPERPDLDNNNIIDPLRLTSTFLCPEPELPDRDNNNMIDPLRFTETNVPTPTLPVNNTDSESFQRLYVPEWYIEAITSDDEPEAINKDIRGRCWITNEMSEEIRSYYPTKDEIHIDDALGDCTRDLEAFSQKCALMFPEGRIFMSYVQFSQAAQHFLEGWNCKKVSSSFKVTCFYTENRKSNKYVSKCEPCKRRKKICL